MAQAPKSTHVGGDTRPMDSAAVVKDLVVTAILSLAILGPIVGLKTVTATGTLALVQRWGLVAVLIAIVVGGRLLHHLYVWSKPEAGTKTKGIGFAVPDFSIAKYLGPGLLLVAISLPFLAGMAGSRERQIMDLAILILT